MVSSGSSKTSAVFPMYFDRGDWWLTCDHMFLRFEMPFAFHWLAKKINMYLYTATTPAASGTRVEASNSAIATRRGPLVDDPEYAEKIGSFLDAVLPT